MSKNPHWNVGSANPNADLSPKMVLKIARLRAEQELSAAQIARKYKVSVHAVEAILAGKTWAHLTGGRVVPLSRTKEFHDRPLSEPRDVIAAVIEHYEYVESFHCMPLTRNRMQTLSDMLYAVGRAASHAGNMRLVGTVEKVNDLLQVEWESWMRAHGQTK